MLQWSQFSTTLQGHICHSGYQGLFVCLFFSSFSFHSRIFHSFEEITIAGEGLHIFTYARHLRPLRRKGSLACHTYWASVYNGRLRGPVTLTPNAERLAVQLSVSLLTWICTGKGMLLSVLSTTITYTHVHWFIYKLKRS